MMNDYKLHLVIRTPQACLWEQSALKSYARARNRGNVSVKVTLSTCSAHCRKRFMSSLYQFHSHLFHWIIFMFCFLMIHDSDCEWIGYNSIWIRWVSVVNQKGTTVCLHSISFRSVSKYGVAWSVSLYVWFLVHPHSVIRMLQAKNSGVWCCSIILCWFVMH